MVLKSSLLRQFQPTLLKFMCGGIVVVLSMTTSVHPRVHASPWRAVSKLNALKSVTKLKELPAKAKMLWRWRVPNHHAIETFNQWIEAPQNWYAKEVYREARREEGRRSILSFPPRPSFKMKIGAPTAIAALSGTIANTIMGINPLTLASTLFVGGATIGVGTYIAAKFVGNGANEKARANAIASAILANEGVHNRTPIYGKNSYKVMDRYSVDPRYRIDVKPELLQSISNSSLRKMVEVLVLNRVERFPSAVLDAIDPKTVFLDGNIPKGLGNPLMKSRIAAPPSPADRTEIATQMGRLSRERLGTRPVEPLSLTMTPQRMNESQLRRGEVRELNRWFDRYLVR